MHRTIGTEHRVTEKVIEVVVYAGGQNLESKKQTETDYDEMKIIKRKILCEQFGVTVGNGRPKILFSVHSVFTVKQTAVYQCNRERYADGNKGKQHGVSDNDT